MLTKTIQIATLHDNTEHTTQKFELQLDLKHYWELSLLIFKVKYSIKQLYFLEIHEQNTEFSQWILS